MSASFILISGCSGGGKSTLLAELAARVHRTVPEPGRRVVQEQQASGGDRLPWGDLEGFLRRVVETALADRAAASLQPGPVFFDRGLIDAASALETLTGQPVLADLRHGHRYHRRVFLAPPWPEIYAADAERRHGFEEAVAEYERLVRTFPLLGYEIVPVPKIPVAARADFILATMADACGA